MHRDNLTTKGVSVRVRQGGYAVAEVTRRTANESMILEMPLKIKLMPTKVPITQTEPDGQRRQIKKPRIKVIMPSNKTQPAFAAPRILKYKTISTTPSNRRNMARRSVSESTPNSGCINM